MEFRSVWVCALAVALTACSAERKTHRNPAFLTAIAPKPTLLTRTISCLEAAEVAGGGLRIRRDTGMGKEAVMRLDEELARMGKPVVALPKLMCGDLKSEQAEHDSDFTNPPPPKTLPELLQISGAKSLLVPMVSSRMQCDRGTSRWAFDEPAYFDEAGDVDCHETELVFAAYLYGADGTLLWKGFHRYAISAPLDSTKAVNRLMESAPVARLR